MFCPYRTVVISGSAGHLAAAALGSAPEVEQGRLRSAWATRGLRQTSKTKSHQEKRTEGGVGFKYSQVIRRN